MNIIQLPAGKLSMNIGLNYGSVHPDANLRGTAMAASKALDVIVSVLTNAGFESFTVNETTGFWQGKPEKSLEVIVYGADTDSVQRWQQSAEVICRELFQEAVLVAIDNDARASLVTGV